MGSHSNRLLRVSDLKVLRRPNLRIVSGSLQSSNSACNPKNHVKDGVPSHNKVVAGSYCKRCPS